MDSQKSPLLHHSPPFLPPPPPPSPPVHRPPPFLLPSSPTSPLQPHQTSPPVHHPPPLLLPPPLQPHQQEQPSSYIVPTNIIFQQPHQQNNLQLPSNSVSGKNPRPNFVDHSDESSVAAGVEVGAKKKRGRPIKYPVDGDNGSGLSPTPIAQIPVNRADSDVAAAGGGVNGAASSENPAKKGRGRPPGSGKKQKLEASGATGSEFTPHFIHVHTGEDIVHKVMAFSLQGPPATCVLSATGVVSNVTLQRTTIGGGTVTYEGRFNIISLSGSFLLSESNGNRSRTGSLNVSLCGPDGGVLGGVVDGILKAASPVLLVMGSFIPQQKKPPNVGAPVSEAISASLGASSNNSDDENGDERGPFGNAAQAM